MTVRIDLVDVVTELTQATSHREMYEHDRTGTATHITLRPCLIAQLRVAMLHSAVSDVGGRPGFMSQPAARLDALDALLRMDQEGVRWVHALTRRPVDEDLSTELLVRRVASLGGDNGAVEKDIRAWWLHSRIVTGWETPPFRPNNTCPLCGKRGGLRVRVDREANTVVTYGLCVECKSQWTGEDGTFDRLAWHIRVENDDTADTRHAVGS